MVQGINTTKSHLPLSNLKAKEVHNWTTVHERHYALSKLEELKTIITLITHWMRQSACLVVNPITVSNFPSLCNCTPVGLASDSVMDTT